MRPRRERSAGVIPYRLEPDGSRIYLLLDYGRHWDFPKGHLEAGEDDTTAALRELEEETGISDAYLHPTFAREIDYFFRDRRGRLVHKTVAFFLGRTASQTVRLSDEHVGFAFLSFDVAVQRLTFASAREILKAGEALLLHSEGHALHQSIHLPPLSLAHPVHPPTTHIAATHSPPTPTPTLPPIPPTPPVHTPNLRLTPPPHSAAQSHGQRVAPSSTRKPPADSLTHIG